MLGSGVQNRFLRFESAKMLARPDVEALIEAARARRVDTSRHPGEVLPYKQVFFMAFQG
jgi:hypothetical protein